MTSIHTVNRAGVSIDIDVKALSPEIIEQLIRHGLTQKIGDAAAGAKKIADETGVPVETVAASLMAKVRDALLAGDWGVTRTAASGVSEETAVARLVTRAVFKKKLGANSEKWAKFTGLSDAEQNAKLDAVFAENRAALQPLFDAEMERRAILAKAKAKPVSIDLDF